MPTPLAIRPLPAAERDRLEAGLRAAEALTVRHAMHAFHPRGMRALPPTSSRPHRPKPVFDTKRRERLRALWHQSPCLYGRSTRVWTLALAAEGSDVPGPALTR